MEIAATGSDFIKNTMSKVCKYLSKNRVETNSVFVCLPRFVIGEKNMKIHFAVLSLA